MCDYSLQNVKSRAAEVDDKLIVSDFGTGTRGFAPAAEEHVTGKTAVCLLPGTELAFDKPIEETYAFGNLNPAGHKVACFRQINKDNKFAHHDAIELPSGEVILLNRLAHGQRATVLQLPAAPKTKEEAEAQQRVAFVG